MEIQDEAGRRLAKARLPEGISGIARLHALVGRFLPEDGDAAGVKIGIETDRGPWVAALVASGYQVYAINPLQSARARQGNGVSGAKSDAGDAHVLADLVRTHCHQLRTVAGDSEQAGAVKVLTRMHQTLIWDRTRQVLRLRSSLREFFPAALEAYKDLASSEVLVGLQCGWEELPQARAQPQHLTGAVPDQRLVHPGQNLHRAGLLAVPGNRAQLVAMGADQVGQDMSVTGITLSSRDTVALAGTSGLQRVDRVHLVPGGDQRGNPRATVGLDADLHPGGVAVFG